MLCYRKTLFDHFNFLHYLFLPFSLSVGERKRSKIFNKMITLRYEEIQVLP